LKKKQAIDEKLLEEIVNFKLTMIDRYYQTIYYTIGMKNLCDSDRSLNVDFVGAEITLKRPDGKPLNPDMLFQGTAAGETTGLPVEIKSSLSIDADVFENLKEMQRYNENLVGWKTDSTRVSNHVIIFSPNLEDSGRVKRVLEKGLNEKVEEKKLKFNKDFLIWEWALVQSNKFSESECIIVKQSYGDLSALGLTQFNNKLLDGIKININKKEFVTEKEKNLFTRQRPPVEYLMIELWSKILPFLCKDGRMTNIEEIKKALLDFYTSTILHDAKGNKYRIEKEWLTFAMDKLELIGLVKKYNDGQYEAHLDKRIKKDFGRFVCEMLAKRQILDCSDPHVNQIVKFKKGVTNIGDFKLEFEEEK
jgi:hypothetical protein